MNQSHLPSHWKIVRLGDVCNIRYGLGQPPDLDSAGIPMIRATDIKSGKIISDTVIRVKQSSIPTRKNPYLNKGDILVVRSGAYTGDVAMYDGRWETAIAGYDVVASPASGNIDSAFVATYLLGNTAQSYFKSRRERSAQPHLNSEQLSHITLPLPPLPEQRAIARALRAVQEAREARRQELQLERERKAALMQHLFTHGTRRNIEAQRKTRFGQVPSDWREMLLSECALVQTGAAKGRKFGESKSINVRYLRVANVQDGYLDLAEIKYISIRESEVERYKLQHGDVVLTEGGDFDKLGRGFVWKEDIPNCIHQNHIFAVRVNREFLMPDFFSYLTQSQYGKAYFLSVAHRTTNLACINSAKLKAFPVLVPNIEEQEAIVKVLQFCDAKLSALENEVSLLDELFRAMLEELMTGRLRAMALLEV